MSNTKEKFSTRLNKVDLNTIRALAEDNDRKPTYYIEQALKLLFDDMGINPNDYKDWVSSKGD
ncbi:hypothetical protein [Vibrio hyugaensis]|uniref:hypothetical protein n=1 Tax=Vibrio hyugaensis TaxID=1534743 RepID=UPI000CE336DA|nr:hypothetical protein [Vibrio hyugaensis]